MAWRAARSLLVLQQQLQAGAPEARPPATGVDEWGLIGDAAHDPTSDHTPHNFPGWGNQIVTAADFPNRPDLGLDAHRVLDDIRRSRDVRAKYGISNGEIFSNHAVTQGGKYYSAWTWRPYRKSDGSKYADEHYTHGHLSVVGFQAADDTAPWATIGAPAPEEDDDMGASFGPIQLELDATSLTIPPVEEGAADPRAAWINACNDTNGTKYALRLWATTGNGKWYPIGNGLFALESGERLSIQLPKSTSCLSITRKAVTPAGVPVEPTDDLKPYPGHLTVCIERGPVINKAA